MKDVHHPTGDAARTRRDDGPPPCHDALTLTGGGTLARITLGDQTYTLRITQARKLILTK